MTVVMTVPASWCDRAKDRLRQAARQAGIESPGRILKFRAEPEAAAIFELKAKAKRKQVDDGDCVIVCDAGGGTVDVVSYQVRSRKPLSLDQVVVSKGDFCGSVFVDSEFESQLKSILGSEFDRLDASVLAQIRQDFEYKIKRTYDPEAPLDYTVPVTGLSNDQRRAIQDGKLKLDDAVLRTAFDSVMTQIMTLIDDQKDALKLKGLESRLRGILIVGGFGGSEYLHTRIRQEYPEGEGIRVWRGDQSWTAVVQGAVSGEATFHESHAPVKTRLASYNYGILYRQGTSRKVQWLLRKGQVVQSTSHSEPFILRMEYQPWLDEDPYAIILVQLIRTDDDHADDNLGHVPKPLVEISCRVPTSIRHSAPVIQQDPLVWRIPAELVIMMDGPVLSVRCRIRGQDVGAVDLRYHDETDVPPRSDWSSSTSSLPSRSGGDPTDSVVSLANVSTPPRPTPRSNTSSPSGKTAKRVINPWLFGQTKRDRSREPGVKTVTPAPQTARKPWNDPQGRPRHGQVESYMGRFTSNDFTG